MSIVTITMCWYHSVNCHHHSKRVSIRMLTVTNTVCQRPSVNCHQCAALPPVRQSHNVLRSVLSWLAVTGMFRLQRRQNSKVWAIIINKQLDREVTTEYELVIKAEETSRKKRAGKPRQASSKTCYFICDRDPLQHS